MVILTLIVYEPPWRRFLAMKSKLYKIACDPPYDDSDYTLNNNLIQTGLQTSRRGQKLARGGKAQSD